MSIKFLSALDSFGVLGANSISKIDLDGSGFDEVSITAGNAGLINYDTQDNLFEIGSFNNTKPIITGSPGNDVSLMYESTRQLKTISNGINVPNRIGIGTTNPLADLHIADSQSNTSGIKFTTVSGGNNDAVNMHFLGTQPYSPFYISRKNTGGAEIQLQFDGDIILNGGNGDNCGIGTTQPSQKLDVNGNVRFRSRFYASNNSSGSNGQVLSSTGTGTKWINQSSAGLGGSGTQSYVPRFTNSSTLGNGTIRDNGSNVAIGATPEAANKLLVNGSLRVVDNIYLNTGTSNSIVGTGGGIEFYTNSLNRLDLTLGGDMTFNGDGDFNIQGGGDIVFSSNTSTSGRILMPNSSDQYIKIGANVGSNDNSFNLSVNSIANASGQQGVVGFKNNYTSSSKPVIYSYSARAGRFSTSTQGEQIHFYGSGTTKVGSVTSNGNSTSYNTSSDYRLKEDAKDFNGLDMVEQIQVYDFKWKDVVNEDGDTLEGHRSHGVFAHELEEIMPRAVVGEKDTETMQGVDYSKIVPVLIKAIQELQEEIRLLKN